MITCLEHCWCDHQVPTCQFATCWTQDTQCPYLIEFCDHYLPSYLECQDCENATPTATIDVSDGPTNMDIDADDPCMGLERPTGDEGYVAKNSEQSWDKYLHPNSPLYSYNIDDAPAFRQSQDDAPSYNPRHSRADSQLPIRSRATRPSPQSPPTYPT